MLGSWLFDVSARIVVLDVLKTLQKLILVTVEQLCIRKTSNNWHFCLVPLLESRSPCPNPGALPLEPPLLARGVQNLENWRKIWNIIICPGAITYFLNRNFTFRLKIANAWWKNHYSCKISKATRRLISHALRCCHKPAKEPCRGFSSLGNVKWTMKLPGPRLRIGDWRLRTIDWFPSWGPWKSLSWNLFDHLQLGRNQAVIKTVMTSAKDVQDRVTQWPSFMR